MSIIYVPQRGDCDCGIAAVAMVTGHPYEQVLEVMNDRIEGGRGIDEYVMQEYLYRHGFAWQKIHRVHQLGGRNQQRSEWPVKPFAPAHVIFVQATMGGHFTVMDGEGRIFDPWKRERASLADPDYKDIYAIYGIWKVREALAC